MKRNGQYFLRNVGDTWYLQFAPNYQEGENKMIFLNETAAFLWTKMNDSCSIEDLVRTLMENYDVQEKVAEQNVTSFIGFLVENGCLEIENHI